MRLLLLMLWFSFFSAQAHSSKQDIHLFFEQDNRVAIQATHTEPWQAIGQVETESGNLCTGTLISPSLVLTAGHCVLAPPGKLDKAISVRFEVKNKKWRYQSRHLDTLVPSQLPALLKADGESWIIPPDAAVYDYALIRLKQAPFPIKPLSLWQQDGQALFQALQLNHHRVTQAGYPEDHLDSLYMHKACSVTGWAQEGVLSHRCDTLPGDSGSPLLLKTEQGWFVIAIQSSAPPAEDRYRADNRALSASAIRQHIQELMTQHSEKIEK